MRLKPLISSACILAASLYTNCAAASYEPARIMPPAPKREFRGVWVATVDNIDWPSKKDLGTAEQKAELLALIERAARLKLNAIVLQVRPQCDAIYPSPLEPWSEFLTGQMGRAPQPSWDPLAFAVEESHKRGIELHAWFNPYRALHPAAKGPVSSNHVSKKSPQLTRSYGKYLWLDPGERAVQDYSLSVVMDVVKRYDVDAIHFDDYFYPYKDKIGDREVEFPDEASWQRYGAGGKLNRGDWRRENVNEFVRRVYQSIKATKPWVKLGISPFGIWRPGHPPQIKGYDAYEKLYADARKWLRDGSVDYFVPQLYWPIEPRDQSFPVLLDWWNEQNPKRRHIWPGLATYKATDWKADELINQVKLAEQQPVSAGHVHYSMKPLARNTSLLNALRSDPYADPALVPACGWLKAPKLSKPKLIATTPSDGGAGFNWSLPAAESATLWLVQTRSGAEWKSEVTTALSRNFVTPPEVIAVSAINRVGVASVPAVLRRK